LELTVIQTYSLAAWVYSFENFLNSNTASTFGGIHQATAAWYIKGLSKEKGMSRLINVLM
jgi:hypothetical protein